MSHNISQGVPRQEVIIVVGKLLFRFVLVTDSWQNKHIQREILLMQLAR
jgi:hypothetical protein